MRLVCPNCGAQYEVPVDVIPDNGRDVQCSNCGHTWFQPHPDQDADLADELGQPFDAPDDIPSEAPAAAPDTPLDRQISDDPAPDEDDSGFVPPPVPPRTKRNLDPDVAGVLRQEAEREAKVRAAEREALESQPELGLDSARAELRQPAPAAEAVPTPPPAPQPRPEPDRELPAEKNSRRAMLPDIDEINSTLRSATEKREIETAQARADEVDEDKPRGFGRGFRVAILLAVVLAALYVFAPKIKDLVPQTTDVVDSYVTTIDSARVWLDGQMQAGLKFLDGLSSESDAE